MSRTMYYGILLLNSLWKKLFKFPPLLFWRAYWHISYIFARYVSNFECPVVLFSSNALVVGNTEICGEQTGSETILHHYELSRGKFPLGVMMTNAPERETASKMWPSRFIFCKVE